MKTLTTTKAFFYSAALLLGGLAFFATACDDEDATGPVITVEEPLNGDSVQAGEEHGLHMEFDLEDESGLNTYKIDIHSGAGHSHPSPLKVESTGWSFQKVYEDAKNLKNHHVHIHSDSVPADARGDYHLGISATDVHGNESSVYITFVVAEHVYGEHEDEDEHDDENE
ncbi:MAG: DUF4625 domain-containing protein [Prevotellaceae bacterium]|jgi:hypothetical protein|nr:DUF4625 domain-containing protein [Prevotellaceae bacterium]